MMSQFAGNTVRVAGAVEARSPSSSPEPGPSPQASSGRRAAQLEELCGTGAIAAVTFPMLDVTLARLPVVLGRRFSEAWKRHAVIAGQRPVVAPYDRAANFAPGLRLFGTFRCNAGEGIGLVGLPAQAVWQMLDCMLGGSGGAPVERAHVSHLEKCLMRAAVDHVLAAMGEALEPVGAISFQFDDWADDSEPARPGSPGGAVLRLDLALTLPQGDSVIEILLPFSMFETHHAALAAPDPGEMMGQDALWRERLADQVRLALITVDAILYEGDMPVGAIRALKPGDSFSFGLPPNSVLQLKSGGHCLALAQLGRSGPLAAVRLESGINMRSEGQPWP